MELWFVMAVLSAITIGLFSYVSKVAAMKGYDSALFTLYGNVAAAFFALIAVLYVSGFSEWVPMMLYLALIGGVLHTVGQVIRMDALRYIDATIYFPLYKVAGPVIMLVIAMLFFAERFTSIEWLGIVLSLFVPLLLISHSEKHRQNNLVKGLWFVLFSAFFTAVAGSMNKVVADNGLNAYLFIFITVLFGITYCALQYWYNHRKENVIAQSKAHTSTPMLGLAVLSGLFQYLGFITYILSLEYGASLGIAYTINSLYILIPIVLAIIFFNEHWNTRKIFAIIVSILALGFLR